MLFGSDRGWIWRPYNYLCEPRPRDAIAIGTVFKDLESLRPFSCILPSPWPDEVLSSKNDWTSDARPEYDFSKTAPLIGDVVRHGRYVVRLLRMTTRTYDDEYYRRLAVAPEVDAWMRGKKDPGGAPAAYVVTGIYVAEDQPDEGGDEGRSVMVETLLKAGVAGEPTTTPLHGKIFGVAVTKMWYKRFLGVGPRRLTWVEEWYEDSWCH